MHTVVLTLSFLQIDWTKAAKDFKPGGKPISHQSFKTSITRLLANYTPGPGVSMGTPIAGRKRKAVTASASPAASPALSSQDTTARKRTKTARVAAAAAVPENSDIENSEDPSENFNDDQVNNETQDDDNDKVDRPSDEPGVAKAEPQSEWLGNEDMFQGDSSPFLSFLPVV